MSNEQPAAKALKNGTGSVKSKVYVLYTGGTFGMVPDLSTPGHPLRPMELKDLEDALPNPNDLAQGIEVTLDRFTHVLDSSSMTPADWEDIAKKIEENYKDKDDELSTMC